MSTEGPIKRHFVAYYRLSKESRSGGLGLDAQRQAILTYLSTTGCELLREYTEIESGRRTDRPQLHAAIQFCRRKHARLCIAKLDRLARNAAFLLTLRDSGVDFVAADMPNADRLTIGVLAIFAEHERDVISQRTRDALAEAKRRGIKLGSPNPKIGSIAGCRVRAENATRFTGNILPLIRDIEESGALTLREVADALNRRGFRTRRGCDFLPQTVSRLLKRGRTAARP